MTMRGVGFWRKQDIPPRSPPRKHRRRSLVSTLVISVLASAILIAAVATGDNSSNRSPVLSPVEIAKQGLESVLRVYAEGPMGKGSGSAIQVTNDTLVTNFHVVKMHVEHDWELYTLSENGEKIPFEVVEYFKAEDFAILRAKQDLPGENAIFANPVILGYDAPIPAGAPVYAVGFPVATDRLNSDTNSSSFMQGEVSASFSRNAWVDEYPLPPVAPFWITQHTAPTNPGTSGGALLNACGEVVGINTQREARMMKGPGRVTLVVDPIQGIFFSLDAGTMTRLLDVADIQYEQSETSCEPWAE
jgi:S1-C subfamily serine protease